MDSAVDVSMPNDSNPASSNADDNSLDSPALVQDNDDATVMAQDDDKAHAEIMAQAEQERLMALPAMQLLPVEREWALAIKRAVEADEELQNLNDLEYVQYGIVTHGDVEGSLTRMHGLQLFRQEYGIDDTLEQGIYLLQALLEQQPGLLLSVDKAHLAPDPQEQQQDLFSHYMMILDFAKTNPKAVRLPRDKRDLLGGLYYAHHLTQTTPASIRNGILFMVECEGMSFDNINVDVVQGPVWRELKSHYPIYKKEISFYRAATAATVMYALIKSVVPREVKDKVRMGCELGFEFDGRLDELFLTQPTPEENMTAILQKAIPHLAERCHNAKYFRL